MNIKRLIAGASAGLLVALAVPGAAFAATSTNYVSHGTYEEVAGLKGSQKAVQLSANSANTAGSNLELKDLVGSTLGQLTELSTDFKVTTGDCNGGSPRFYTILKNAEGIEVGQVVYYISYNTPCAGVEQNSGNVAAGTAVVETHGTLSDLNGKTFAEVQAKYGDLIISELGLVADNAASSDNGQVIVFDNVVTNAGSKQYTYTFEPVVTPAKTVPTDKDQCKNNGYTKYVNDKGQTFKNQGDCVSFVASGGKAKGNPVKEDTGVIATLSRLMGIR